MIYCTLITAMLILVYKKQNDIKSYKIAKIRFAAEIKASCILDLIQTPEGLNIYKKCLLEQIEMERVLKKRKIKKTRIEAKT